MCLCTSECWSVKVMFWHLELHVPLDMFIMTTEYVVLYCSNQDIYCIVVQSVFFNINWDIMCRSYSKTIRQIKVFHYMDRKNSIQMQLSNSLAYCCIVHNRLIQIRYIKGRATDLTINDKFISLHCICCPIPLSKCFTNPSELNLLSLANWQ